MNAHVVLMHGLLAMALVCMAHGMFGAAFVMFVFIVIDALVVVLDE